MVKKFINNNKRQIGEIHLLNLKKLWQNKKYKRCRDKNFSQYGEDGIINFLLHKLNFKNNSSFVEIGTGDYEEANTRFLCETMISRGLQLIKFMN